MARKLISFDWAMKKLLRSKVNFGILEGFLSELLNEDIKIIEILESESNQDTRADKSNRVDLKVKDSNGEIIIIEVQYTQEWDYYQRVLFATSKAVTEHIDAGKNYKDIVKVISVNILYFDLGHGKDYVYHGTTNFIGIHTDDELELTAKQKMTFKKDEIYQIFPEYYLLKINNFNDKAKNTLDEWIYFLKNQEVKKSFKAKGLKEAKKKLDVMLLTEKKRKEYESYIEDKRVLRSEYWTAKTDGIMEGLAKGKTEEKINTVLKMHSKGCDIALIGDITGFTANEIEKILIGKKINSPDTNKVTEKPVKYSSRKRKPKKR